MHLDPALPTLVGAALAILLVGLLLRRLGQPQVVAYLLAGVLMGPSGLQVFSDTEAVARAGDVGVVLLLFFVGMDVSVRELARSWRIAILGTGGQILVSVGVVALAGWWMEWPIGRSVLLGFVISLSSTAVVVSILQSRGELATERGRDALSVLLVQDVAVVPMLIVIGLMGGGAPDPVQVFTQTLGGVAIVGLFVYLSRRDKVSLPLERFLGEDHELQVFAAFVLCFGLASISALLGLSTALGAFVAGVLLAAAKETEWVHRALEPLRVIFVAFFFVSIGLLVDLRFIADNALGVSLMVALALVTNTAINGAILWGLGRDRAAALHGGALLAPIGEFSFVLVAVGLSNGMISSFGYQLVVAIIAISLVVSPAWFSVLHRKPVAEPPG